MTPTTDPLHAAGADAAGQLPQELRSRPWLPIAAGLLALAMLLLGLLGLVIGRGGRFAFDSAILLAARGGGKGGDPAGPEWVTQAMIDITALGGETVLVLVVALTAGFLATRRLWLTMLLVLGGTISGSIAVALAKAMFARARPDLTEHLVAVASASFPSGHAANSAIIYLTIVTLLMQIVRGALARGFILTTTALLVIAIGSSRVYLGVHWPTDVLAGWAFGMLWALAWWALGAGIRLKRAGRSLLAE